MKQNLMDTLYLHQFRTRLGWFWVASTDRGMAIISLPGEKEYFEEKKRKKFRKYRIVKGGKENKKAEREIKAYLNGRLKKFSLRLDITGTPFQKKVLKKVINIPYGETATYGEIARAIGRPKAARAVGSANASNCLPLVIPCHRVLASNGLGGYRGGLKIKQSLLQLENLNF
ncbi:MAG: methylated-DNA--[protein]-cysteine S-methyltransferase [candidate division Zixibacteria bacterium]|nr:methylated-DNA--[protein]-cysteine S-methyltransferase [candidate division Zixibacteria bacterium]